MNKLKQFQIDIHNLREGKYEFDFTIDDSYFEILDQELIEKGKLEVKLALTKGSNMIKSNFITKGEVELTCDRTLQKFNHPIDVKNTMIYKFGDHDEELTDELMMIKTDTSIIDVSQIIFDFIALAVPLKKIHPDFITDKDTEGENDILIYSSVSDDKELTDNDIDILDPRWEALKKLKDTF